MRLITVHGLKGSGKKMADFAFNAGGSIREIMRWNLCWYFPGCFYYNCFFVDCL